MALACLCLPLLNVHADRALEVLRQAVNADGSVAYAGRCEISVFSGGKCQGRQVQQVTRGPGNCERIEVTAPAEQAGRLIISDGATQWEYHPRFKLVVERHLPPLAEVRRTKLQALEAVRRTLFPAYQGIATIAGRRCHVVTIRPPDGRRVRKRLWVDAGKLVELKWERYDTQGTLTVSWAMTDVDFTPSIGQGAFQYAPPAGVTVKRLPLMPRMDLGAAQKKVGFRAVVPEYLPPGFVFQRSRVGVGTGRGAPSLWMHFTDGVDTFTLVQARPLKHRPKPGDRAFHWEAQGFVFVLVGPIADSEKQKVKEATLN